MSTRTVDRDSDEDVLVDVEGDVREGLDVASFPGMYRDVVRGMRRGVSVPCDESAPSFLSPMFLFVLIFSTQARRR